jgi:hypothetical protein
MYQRCTYVPRFAIGLCMGDEYGTVFIAEARLQRPGADRAEWYLRDFSAQDLPWTGS